MVVVVAFFAVYVGAAIGFGWTGVQLLWSAFVLQDDRHVMGGIVGAAQLAATGLIVSSFFRRRAAPTWRGVAVTATNQPTLFAVIAQLARATAATPPDRVMLGDEVAIGAAFAPGRAPRVLTIGLGLVGGLDRRALEATIARELWVLEGLASWPRRGLAYIEHLLGQYGLRELAVLPRALRRLQRAFDRAIADDAARHVVERGITDAATLAALPAQTAALERGLAAARRFVAREALHGLAVADLFEVQARLPVVDGAPATFPGTAWEVFDRAEAVRVQVTAATHARPAWQPPLARTPMSATLARLDAMVARPHLEPRYRGRYDDAEPATPRDDAPRLVHQRLAATLSPAWADALDTRWQLRRWARRTADELRAIVQEVDDAIAPAIARGGALFAAERIATTRTGTAVAVYRVELHTRVAAVTVPEDVRARLVSPSWSSAFAAPLGPPGYDLDAWLAAMRHVVAISLDALDDLAAAALDELLVLEDRVAALAAGDAGEVPPAPSLAQVPTDAPRAARTDGAPRPTTPTRRRRPQLLIDLGRTAAALAVIGGALVATHFLRKVEVVAYNGTGGPVVVTIDGERRTVAAGDHARFHVSAGRIAVSTRTADGQNVEDFHEWIDERHRYVYDVAAALPLLEQTIVYAENVDSVDVPDARSLPVQRWHALTTDWLFVTPPKTKEVSKGQTKTYTRVMAIPREDPTMALAATPVGSDFEVVLEAQLRWRPTSARFADAWWRAGTYLAGFARLLDRRLARTPDDPLLRTIEQDYAGPRHAQVCADHRARAAARPDDPSWQYLAARCLEPAARIAAMEAARARWPDEPWVLLGTGQAAAAHGDLVAADLRLTSACSAMPSYCPAFAVDLARVRRGLGADPFLGLPIADGPDAYLVEPNADAWWPALARGELTLAVQAADGIDGDFDGARARWLAAASDDAAPAFLTDAEDTAAGAGGDDPTIALVIYALRARAGRAAPTDLDEAVNAAVVDAGSDGAHAAAALRGFLTLLMTADGAHVDAADAALDPIAPVLRGRAYVAAAVLLGPRCPPRWRTLAQRLLFEHERPWFRPA